jgi:hypothetical protein
MPRCEGTSQNYLPAAAAIDLLDGAVRASPLGLDIFGVSPKPAREDATECEALSWN